MILDASGREMRSMTVSLEVTHLADVAALYYLLNALMYGADYGISYSRTVAGHEITGPFVAIRAGRNGVQQRSA